MPPMVEELGEFYCPDCNNTFDLRPGMDTECPHCGGLSVMPTVSEEEA